MTTATQSVERAKEFKGNDSALLGIVLAVITFWLFAQTTLNIGPAMGQDMDTPATVMNIAISLSALFSGMFIVVAGGFADRIGRVRMTTIGNILGIVGSLLVGFAITGGVGNAMLLIGRILQGLSAACIMPATMALLKTYWQGAARQRAVSMWSIGSWGGSGLAAIYKEMIRETIKEHLRKETQLRAKSIKVLSLFFIDKVESFLGDGSNNNDAKGQFVQWFDKLFREERAKSPLWQELLRQDPAELRRGYFSVLRGKRGAPDGFKEVSKSGTTKAEDDAYELIMQDKERLLDENEPTRFVFSHSALREGWDNPNVFQICTLREMGAETERRQTLGRGLRLPVAKTDDGYTRVADRGVATLTVVANESYTKFADALQREYKDAGVEIGRVRKAEFSKIPLQNPDGSLTDENLGYEGSVSIWEYLLAQKFIDMDGVVQPKFQPNTLDFSLNMPVDFMWAEPFVIELVGRANIGKYVKPKSKRRSRKLNKELFANPEFEKFWETISRRTTYRVEVERDKIIENSVKAIKEAPDIEPLRIQVIRAGVKVPRGGAKGQELGSRQQELRGSYDLPDIIGELQEATSLTRKTIVDILVGSGRLDEFIANRNDFIAMARRLMQTELAKLVVDGVQYEKVAGSVYELRELRKDGEEEKERFLDQMYKLENAGKSNFDYVVYDSGPEREFAELLDGREDIKFFMKLPDKFKIDTPVGPYNPDWAIVKYEDGEERVYMIRETKSTEDEIKRRPTENAKIKAATKHFAAVGLPDYAVSVPGSWKL